MRRYKFEESDDECDKRFHSGMPHIFCEGCDEWRFPDEPCQCEDEEISLDENWKEDEMDFTNRGEYRIR